MQFVTTEKGVGKQKWIAEPGKFKAYIAASSEDIRGVVEFEYSNIE